MAPIDLRWLCAPLLFVSSLAFAQDGPALPPVFTSYVVPFNDLINTPRGEGACVAGFVEAICNTGGTNQCFGYKENDGDSHYSMRVRSTGYYCGDWSDYNDPRVAYPGYDDHENLAPMPDPEPAQLSDYDDLVAKCGSRRLRTIFIGDAGDGGGIPVDLIDYPTDCYASDLIDKDNLHELDIHELQTLVSATRDYIRGLNGYLVDSLNNKSDKYVVDFLNARLNDLDSDFDAFMAATDSALFSLADRQDEVEELYSIAKNTLDTYLDLINEAYGLAHSALPRDEFYSYMNDNTDRIYRSISNLENAAFTSIGTLNERVGNELSGVYDYFGDEITTLAAGIDANNADIASSIDAQTGEVVGAIEDQSSIVSDGFGDLTDFFGNGEPSTSDLANQDSELSGLVSDYDYFVDYDIDIGEAVCPAPYQLDISVAGKTVYVSFEPICEASVLVKPLLIAASSVAFALIVMGVRRA